MLNNLIIAQGKIVNKAIKTLKMGSGSTWPGHIALKLNKNFIEDEVSNCSCKKVLISGTNGKTTTTKLITTILRGNGFKVFHNDYGANLLNGIASSLIENASIFGQIKTDYAIFEVDENNLPSAIKSVSPDYVILLNLFRDQLDRYGEINSIAKKWKKALEALNPTSKLILNADDPLVASLKNGKRNNVYYFGIDKIKNPSNKMSSSADSIYCINCNAKLSFKTVYFSHLGDWSCSKCKTKRPDFKTEKTSSIHLPGVYNQYNIQAALLFAKLNNISPATINKSLANFIPAFGRQESIEFKGNNFFILLSKNPTSFNESLKTVNELNGKNIFIILNNRIPDGKDVSWIYDTDIETLLLKKNKIIISGDRAYDMELRLKNAGITENVMCFENFKEAINHISGNFNNQKIYVLPTYSAMLELRKELTGNKLL